METRVPGAVAARSAEPLGEGVQLGSVRPAAKHRSGTQHRRAAAVGTLDDVVGGTAADVEPAVVADAQAACLAVRQTCKTVGHKLWFAPSRGLQILQAPAANRPRTSQIHPAVVNEDTRRKLVLEHDPGLGKSCGAVRRG